MKGRFELSPKPVRKAIFPVAGLGTRFLPATKAMPKEMLTVVDRPIIQHVVDEARTAGIEHLIFVTGRNKAVIEEHFDYQFELVATLKERGKTRELRLLEDLLPPAGSTSFTRQQKPLGLGHAVWCARELVGDEPFALLLPDVIVPSGGRSCLAEMIAMQNRDGGNLIAVEEVAPHLVDQYGIVDIGGNTVDGDTSCPGRAWPIRAMVEKPAVGSAPSNLSIMGRYILQPEIFEILGHQAADKGGEIQITDAMEILMAKQPFHAVKLDGRSFDCGSKLGFLSANLHLGVADETVGDALREELRDLLGKSGV